MTNHQQKADADPGVAAMADITVEPAVQDVLFDGDFAPVPEDMGFRGPTACQIVGITYRQLDYWARTDLVKPSVRETSVSGNARLYSFGDVLLLKTIKNLIDAGISLQQIRLAVEHLHARGVNDLTQVTLVSDGVSVYELTDGEQLTDLLRGGQGMFAIGLGAVWRQIKGVLLEFPTEAATVDLSAEDELASRRAKRRTG